MVCVIGLFTQLVHTSTYNIWGQLICMLLIQIGGLGLMTFIGIFYIKEQSSVFVAVRLFKKVLVMETQSLKDLHPLDLLTTFWVEGLGAFLLSFRFILNLN